MFIREDGGVPTSTNSSVLVVVLVVPTLGENCIFKSIQIKLQSLGVQSNYEATGTIFILF